MQITVMPGIQHYEISVLKLWLTRKFGLLGSTTYTFAIQSKNMRSLLCCVGGDMVFLQSGMLLRSKNLSQAGVLAVTLPPEPRHPSVSSWASCETLHSLWHTTNHHSLGPHLSESLLVTCVFLPIMSRKVINKGFDLNWLLWNEKCP